MKIKIKKIYKYLPQKVESLEHLCKINKWDKKKIYSKTGILEKRVSGKKQTIKDLIIGLRKKNKIPELKDCGLMILVTQTPHYLIPANIHFFQKVFNVNHNSIAFDVNQGCSGYVHGLAICNSMIEKLNIKKAALITCDTYSKYISKNNRTTRTLFGDAITVSILEKSNKKHFFGFKLGSNHKGFDNFKMNKNEILMNGAEMYNFGSSSIPNEINSILNSSKIKKNDIKFYLFHQASKLILDTISRKLNIPEKKIVRNIMKVGNTVSSSIPLLIYDLINKKKLKSNDIILMSGFGVGYSWGSCIYKN